MAISPIRDSWGHQGSRGTPTPESSLLKAEGRALGCRERKGEYAEDKRTNRELWVQQK